MRQIMLKSAVDRSRIPIADIINIFARCQRNLNRDIDTGKNNDRL